MRDQCSIANQIVATRDQCGALPPTPVRRVRLSRRFAAAVASLSLLLRPRLRVVVFAVATAAACRCLCCCDVVVCFAVLLLSVVVPLRRSASPSADSTRRSRQPPSLVPSPAPFGQVVSSLGRRLAVAWPSLGNAALTAAAAVAAALRGSHMRGVCAGVRRRGDAAAAVAQLRGSDMRGVCAGVRRCGDAAS